MKLFIIAGIGDHTDYIYRRVKNWPERFGLEPITLRFGWHGDYQTNYGLLKQAVIELSKGETCAIIGISAGASAALRLKAELLNISHAITICGRVTRGGFTIKNFSKYPAYWESVDSLKKLSLKKNILVLHPLFDEVVAIDHMIVRSAKSFQVPYLLHIPSIILILSRQANTIASFIKTETTI